MKKNQIEFGFNTDLGIKVEPNFMLLQGEVLFSLNPKKYYLDYNNPNEGSIYWIFCPFCSKGNLKLTRVLPLESGDGFYLGNQYEYGCTFCPAVFMGTIFWEPENREI